MNERHPSGYAPEYDPYAYDVYSTGVHQAVGTAFADDTATGAYGYIPQQSQAYGTGDDYGRAEQQNYDPYGPPVGTAYYDTGTYDATQFASYQQPQQQVYGQQDQQDQQDWDSGGYQQAYQAYGYGYGYDASGDTGIYEQFPQQDDRQPRYEYRAPTPEPTAYEVKDPYAAEPDAYVYEAEPEAAGTGSEEPAAVAEQHDYAADGFEPGAPPARSRRRKPAKRSALLTVAVPSVAVMGVAAVGAAAVTGVGVSQDSPKAQADAPKTTPTTGPAPTTQLDRQLVGVSQDATDFADRASRTQERIDLKDRVAAAKRAAAAAAARKEALRPKYVLPVRQHGLSAYFGQAGVNWMALHTGIDFPVMVGTPVMAVTDGTVRTQWNSSYGNMAIVTAPNGTETWYCHLSSTKIRSGSVKAGTVIAYSGNTGNTTGPHLHLEVRPGGGSPIDPLPWLLKHGLDPR